MEFKIKELKHAIVLAGCILKSNETEVIIPEGVTKIECGVFRGCESQILTVMIPNSVKKIDGFAFHKCTSLREVNIPDSVAEIGDYAFGDCSNLEMISIPKSIIKINENTFNGCIKLREVYISDGVKEIGRSAFEGCNCLSIIHIPESVTKIGAHAFAGCGGLTIVDIPNNVKEISIDAFRDCINLSKINISNKVTRIESGTFHGCKNLSSILIPDSVTTICDAFDFPVAVHIENIEALSGDNRLLAILGLAEEPDVDWKSERAKNHIKYLKSLKSKSTIQIILENPQLLQFVLDHKTITTGQIDLFIQIAESINSTLAKASLMEYQHSTIGKEKIRKAKEKINSKKEKDIDEVVDRAITRAKRDISEGIAGLTFVITGKLETFYGRESVEEYLTSRGANLASGINAQVDYLVTNNVNSGSEKNKKAAELGIEVIDENEFNKILGGFEDVENVVVPKHINVITRYAFANHINVKEIVFHENVRIIEEYAFRGCTNLTSISIPDSVNEIGRGAFEGCINLISITIPESVRFIGDNAFCGCLNLKSINVPTSFSLLDKADVKDSKWYKEFSGDFITLGSKLIEYKGKDVQVVIPSVVKEIGMYAFEDSKKTLEAITIPNSVEKICKDALKGCKKLRLINVSSSFTLLSKRDVENTRWYKECCDDYIVLGGKLLEYKGKDAFVIIPPDITEIEDNAFRDCVDITSITIPDSVKAVGEYAFRGCKNLNSINVSSSFTIKGEEAFSYTPWYENCADDFVVLGSMLLKYRGDDEQITVPDNITKIDAWAFSDNKSLTTIRIADNVTEIGDSAFRGCCGLTTVNIPIKVTRIGESSFSNCASLNKINIPEGVTEIGENAFSCCHNLTTINIPQKIKRIEEGVFSGCNTLTTVSIPDGITEIKSWAFYGCKNLTTILIPESVEKIGYCAFHECTALVSVKLPDSIKEIAKSTFSFPTALHIGRIEVLHGDDRLLALFGLAQETDVDWESARVRNHINYLKTQINKPEIIKKILKSSELLKLICEKKIVSLKQVDTYKKEAEKEKNIKARDILINYSKGR